MRGPGVLCSTCTELEGNRIMVVDWLECFFRNDINTIYSGGAEKQHEYFTILDGKCVLGLI